MRHAKILVLALVAVFAVGAATALAAGPEYVYRVSGKKLEAGEKKEVSSKAKTEIVFKGKGALGIAFEVKCKKLKLNAAEKPVIVGGTPGTSEKYEIEFEECTGLVSGSKCSSVAFESGQISGELVSIVAPASKKEQLALLLMPPGVPILFAVNFTKCGIFGSQSVKVEGNTVTQISPEKSEAIAETLIWDASEEITEVKLHNGTVEKVGLKADGNAASLNGEAQVELLSKASWGAF